LFKFKDLQQAALVFDFKRLPLVIGRLSGKQHENQ